MRRFLSVFVALSVTPLTAGALPLPATESLALAPPAGPVELSVAAGDDGLRLAARARGREATATLPVRDVEDVTFEAVDVGGGHTVAVIRGTGGQSFAAVVAMRRGAPVIAWSGRTDLHGDPGERTAARIELDDRTGDGRPDVVVGRVREGATICGQQETLLFPRAWDPARSELRPVVLPRIAAGEEIAVTATRESPGPTGAPLVRALGATGASSTSGHAEDDPSAAAPPTSLFDGRAETFWAEGRGGSGAQEFAAARWSTRFPIRAFALTVSPTGDPARRLGRPTAFWLVGDGGARLRVTVPEDALAHAGERYWVVPPAPLAWSCVALVLDQARSPAGATPAATHTGVAELEAYTELDFGAGVQGLVSILVEGGRPADEAARLLQGLGDPEVVHAVAAAWPRLDEQGHRRAVRIFAASAARDVPGAVPLLAMAVDDPSEEVSNAALEALGTLGPGAGEALADFVARPTALGDRAVRPLLRHTPDIAVSGLLDAIAVEGGSERPALRDALPRAIGRDEAARVELATWLSDAEPSVPARTSVARGLASHPQTRDLAAPIVASLTGEVTRFEDRWRLVHAAADVAPSPEVDAWLAGLAAEAEEWMIRGAALAALGRRAAESRAAAARAALGDDYPRVRVVAIEQLDALDAEDEALAERARRDSWPMVRAAAIEALFDRPAGRDAIREAVDDHSPRVRSAALAALTRAGARDVLPLVTARLRDGEEWPRVTLEALRWVSELCVEEAGEAVLDVVRRGTRPDAWAPDVDVAAVAADLAIRLGGETARDAETMARRAGAPESVRTAVERRLASPRPCAGASSP